MLAAPTAAEVRAVLDEYVSPTHGSNTLYFGQTVYFYAEDFVSEMDYFMEGYFNNQLHFTWMCGGKQRGNTSVGSDDCPVDIPASDYGKDYVIALDYNGKSYTSSPFTVDYPRGESWELDPAGGLHVRGNIPDFTVESYGNRPWQPYAELIEGLYLEDGVTHVGDYAFAALDALSYLEISGPLVSIGNSSFVRTALTEVRLPASVTSIDIDAFYSCTELTRAELPGVTSLGEEVFAGCTKLQSVTLSSKIKTIQDYTFYGCESLAEINLPEGLTVIREGAFHGCHALERVVLPKSVEYIGIEAFADCTGLVSIAIPNPSVVIENNAFAGCLYSLIFYSPADSPVKAMAEAQGFQWKPLYTPGWHKNSKGWWYQNEDGSYKKSEAALIDGKWYRFDAQGYMLTGWQKNSAGKWVYHDKSGAQLFQWQTIGGKRYYFAGDGLMRTGWQKVGGKWYYFSGSGAMRTGWVKVSGKYYYMNGDGVMQTGWIKDGGKWYYLNGSGAMQTGWVKVSGKWYYMNASGAMQTGWVKVSGKWYYMNGSGVMVTGWQKIGGKWYYFNSSGVMQTGSKTIGGKQYYFNSSGAMIGSPNSSDIKTVTYILNISTNKFHVSSCKDVNKMTTENTVYFGGTRSEAIGFGFSACGHCKP